ncbi:MAG: dUTP diphosphatase [Prevotella sp.]|nr:dUTP diphosphatase [Prevotella sp.]
MEVKIKKLHPNAVIPFKAHDKDFCYDCVAVSCEEIAPNVYKYGLGFALEIVRNENGNISSFDNISIDARPRSSVYKTGMVLSNCCGTIDEPYRGEVCAIFYHLFPDMPRYQVGEKIVQIKIGVAHPIEFVEVDELSKTERNEGGFGSTGR